jgi:hypothetical protein
MAASFVNNSYSRSSPDGGSQAAQPIPFSFAIPSEFTPGMVSGNVTCADAYTARIALSPSLQLSDKMEGHLTQGSIAYTQPNIGSPGQVPGFPSGDDRISIAWNGGARTDYLLPEGLYGFADVATQLNLIAAANGWITNPTANLFTLLGVTATQSVILQVNPMVLAGGVFPAGGVVIDFLNPGALGQNDSIGPILGWPTSGAGATLTIAGGGSAIVSFSAPNTANFAITSAYAVYISFLKDSYSNGLTGKLLYVFPLGSGVPNSVLSFQPSLAYAVPVSSGTYSTADVWFTDQSGNRLPLVNFQAPTVISMMIATLRTDRSV